MDRVTVLHDGEAVFTTFFDDAAVFPPGRAPVDVAVTQHLARRGSAPGALVGPLLLTLDHLDAAAAVLAEVGLPAEPLAVGLVVGAEELPRAVSLVSEPLPGTVVSGLEVRPGIDVEQARTLLEPVVARGVTVHLEQQTTTFARAARTLAGSGLRLKYRTGGLDAGLFPSAEDLADVLDAAVSAEVAFKLTAGLHRAVRYTDASTGFSHHGFLNIAVAVQRLRAGAERDAALSALLEDDAAALAAEFVAGDADWRRSFESFGTCSTSEPVETLTALALLPVHIAAAGGPTTGEER